MNVTGFLASRGFAVFLLVVSVILLTVWTGYPDLYSPFFQIVPALLLLSLVVCTVKRVKAGRLGPAVRFWGSIIFHTGMILGVTIMFLSPLMRFAAKMYAIEGLKSSLSDIGSATVIERPVFRNPDPEISLTLNSYDVEYKEGKYPVDYSADVTVAFLEGDEYKKTNAKIRINGPLHVRGYQFLLEHGGYTPLFVLTDKDGAETFRSFVRLVNVPKKEDSFEIEQAGLIVYTRFFPEMYMEGGRFGTRSMLLKNPAFGIKIVRKGNFRQEVVFSCVLRPGESAMFNGMTLTFKDLKSYVMLVVVKDPIYYLVFLSWVIGILGLLMRYLPTDTSSYSNLH